MAATYKDIQRLTGLSLSTISKYFNGGSVKKSTRVAIESVVTQLDYRINDMARGLKSKKSMAVGLLIPRLNSLFAVNMMRHIGHFLRTKGYSCIVCDSDASRVTEREAVNFLIDKTVDGIITMPFDPSGSQLEPAKTRGLPIVFIDRKPASIEADVVLTDNYEAGRIAAKHLIDYGHTETAIIYGPSYVYTMSQRYKGFMDTYAKYCPQASIRSIETFFSMEESYKTTRELLSGKPGVTSLFCVNYELMIGAYAAIYDMGLRYPGDISFVGFDNLEMAQIMKPSITRIEQPMERIARTAADLLIKRIEIRNGGSAEQDGSEIIFETVMYKPTLINGESVARR